MTMVLLGSLTGTLLGWLMGFLSVFLILLILVQRGKGGGLTGALGGPGGQSAFGSKAGDTFTVITIVVAVLWGFACVLTMLILGTDPVPPAVANEPNIAAGPGDEASTSDNLIIPPSGGLGGADVGGDGAADASAPSSGTPSMDLTPAQPAADGPPAPAETPAATDQQAPADSGSDSASVPESESATSEAVTPATESSETDARDN